jgi:hypothetical protein
MTKIQFIIKRLSNPRVRRRLKIGLSIYGGIIMLCLLFKFGYDIGYFNADAQRQSKKAEIPNTQTVLTMESAQRIVSGALKQDPLYPDTLVTQIIDDNQHFSIIVIQNKSLKSIAYIIDMRLFFTGNLLTADGYNLTETMERQNIKHTDY